jgi:ABC-type bacteriocin/lantibiotic exporter with double-glycine peptidase domain
MNGILDSKKLQSQPSKAKWYFIIPTILANVVSQIYKLSFYKEIMDIATIKLAHSNMFLIILVKLLGVHLVQNICKFFIGHIISSKIKVLFNNLVQSIVYGPVDIFKKDMNEKINKIWLYLSSIETLATKLLVDLPIIFAFIAYYIYTIYNIYPQITYFIIPINILMFLTIHPITKKQDLLQKEKINLDLETKNKLTEITSNIEFIKLNNREKFEMENIKGYNNRFISNKMSSKFVESSLSFIYQIYNDLLISLVYFVGGVYMMGHILSPVDLIYIAINTGNLCYYLIQLKDIYYSYKKINMKLYLINQFVGYNTVENQNTTTNMQNDNDNDNNIEFKNITFSYDGLKNVVHNLSFKFEQDKINLLLGANGSGKSTLIKLLLRLYDLPSNEDPGINKIYIGNKNINEIELKYLRNKIIFVSQDPPIFDGTVMYNIKYGNEEMDDKKIINLCDIIHVRDWLLQNMDKMTGYKGKYLTRGDKKKIQLINAICKNSNIIIFDEPTNNLDSNTIKWFTTFIKLLKDNYKKTIIITSHDMRLKDVAENIININAPK